MTEDPRDPAPGAPRYPLQKLLGFHLAEWRPDYARVELELSEQLENRSGLPHGGVHATLLDSAMGYSGCFAGEGADPVLALTLSLTVNFMSRPRGRLLIAEGWRRGGGRSTYFADGQVRDDTGEVIAAGTGVFRYRGTPGG